VASDFVASLSDAVFLSRQSERTILQSVDALLVPASATDAVFLRLSVDVPPFSSSSLDFWPSGDFARPRR